MVTRKGKLLHKSMQKETLNFDEPILREDHLFAIVNTKFHIDSFLRID